MTPTFLVAIILIAYASAFDECAGAAILSAPMKMYKSVLPSDATDSSGPAGSMHNDVWYRVEIAHTTSFTFYGDASDWALYKASSCGALKANSKIAGKTSSLPMILSIGTHFLRVGSLASAPTVAPIFEYAFSVPGDYPVIGNRVTAVVVPLPDPNTLRQDITAPKFHYLTADVDGRDLNANILWDSSWYLITLPPMERKTVTIWFHDLVAPGKDNYASIVMNLYKTPNQVGVPSGSYITVNGLIYTDQMTLKKQSTFYLQIGRTSRCAYDTNYNLTILIEKGPTNSGSALPVTSGALTTSRLPALDLTSSSLTTATVTSGKTISAPVVLPPASSPDSFCEGRSWPKMETWALGYFCAEDNSFYRCDPLKKLNAKMKCPETQQCRCSSQEECSDNGRRSPCK